MSLFQVEGWDMKEKVAVGGTRKKQKKEKPKKTAKKDHSQPKRSRDADEMSSRQNRPKKHKTEDKNEDIGDADAVTPMEEAKPLVSTKLTPLQQKMMAKLSGSRFRWINEQLYTITSEDALKLIKEQPALFDEYHQGFRSQVQSWPENPVDVFVDQIKERAKRPVNAPGGLPGLYPNKEVVVADMGCGEAQLALDVHNFVQAKGKKQKRLNIKVHSFDLKKVNERITVADIKNTPLPDGSCTIVVFCLALMGTNFLDFVQEAHRILAPRGELWIAEIKSRFKESTGASKEDVGSEFVNAVKLNGFFHKNTDNSNKMFTRFEFFKPSKEIIEERKKKLERKKKFIEEETEKEQFLSKREKKPEGQWLLKPCIYKRR